jgi:hypothetical protein
MSLYRWILAKVDGYLNTAPDTDIGKAVQTIE